MMHAFLVRVRKEVHFSDIHVRSVNVVMPNVVFLAQWCVMKEGQGRKFSPAHYQWFAPGKSHGIIEKSDEGIVEKKNEIRYHFLHRLFLGFLGFHHTIHSIQSRKGGKFSNPRMWCNALTHLHIFMSEL